MPVISKSDAPVVMNEEGFRQPRHSVQANTGADLSSRIAQVSGQPPSKEETSPEPSEPKAVTLSPQLAALARKEQEFVKRQQAFKAEQDALAAERAEIAELKALKSKLAAKDYSEIEKLVTYEDYTNFLINKGDNAPSEELQAVNEVKEKLSRLEKQQEEQTNRQFEATKNQFRKAISSHIESQLEQFEGIKAEGQEEEVLNHILKTFEEDGEELSVEVACKEVEEALIERALETAERLSKIKRVQQKFAPQVAPQEKRQLSPPKLRTLTNEAPAAGIAAPRNQFQHLTMKERIAQAVARSQKG